MTEALGHRNHILRSKRQECGSIANSRKRKLRELYSVASDVTPQLAIVSHDTPTPTPEEARFLEENDITQGRTLNLSTLPTRRQLRSATTSKATPAGQNVDARSSEIGNLQSNGNPEDNFAKSKAPTLGQEPVPSSKPPPNHLDGSLPSRPSLDDTEDGPPSSGRQLPKDRQSATTIAVNASSKSNVVEGASQTDENPAASLLSSADLPDGALERDRINHIVESRPGSPGVDPRVVIPVSAEDAAHLPDIFSDPSQDENHKAATIHLPPRDVQEKHLRQINQNLADRAAQNRRDDQSNHLSIKLPSPHVSRSMGDPMSSPGSTVGAQSATTPGLHDASTDTSPENEGPRYTDPDRSDDKVGKDYPQTPPELAPSREEVLDKEEHDRLLVAQIEVARNEILGSSPAAADAQLRLEEEQAAAASSIDGGQIATAGSNVPLEMCPVETAQDMMDDEDDEVVGVPTPEDERMPDADDSSKPLDQNDDLSMQGVAVQLPDPMDIDTSNIQSGHDPNPSTSTIQADASADKLSSTGEKASRASTPLNTQLPTSSESRTVPTPSTLDPTTIRVSSGAFRHKSPSEIIEETPKQNPLSGTEKGERTSFTAPSANVLSNQSRSCTPQTPGSRGRSLLDKARDKDRSKLSTVIFAKQASKKVSSALATKSQIPDSTDYFRPLIVANANNSARGVQPLEALLQSAHKTITTSNAYVPIYEHQATKILRRIHTMQTQDKWSLRQPKRAPEPNRPTTQWDEHLKEMKWMRTDFREERKWKTAVARHMANACAEWVAADEEDRKLLQTNARPPQQAQDADARDSAGSAMDISRQTPDLVPSAESDSPMDEFDEEPSLSLIATVAPTAIFSLNDDGFVLGLKRSAATDKLLEELPLYGSPLSVPQTDLPSSEVDPDAAWKRPALPLSKYIDGKMVFKSQEPPKKRSRYDYGDESDTEEQIIFEMGQTKHDQSEVHHSDVALFNPENKHIRDRIHAGHQFRPPSENPMPLQSFFECRNSSHWLLTEDDELKSLVREYSYNWQLISNMLSSKSMFSSGAERRTPWECFERWIQLEGLPADMQKTHYFRAYNNRLEAAQRSVMAQAQQPPQPNATGAAITPVRRRTTTSMRVERKRNQKHLTIVDAMRKLAKKRETSLQKQQHAAGLAALRKNSEVPQPPAQRHTPQDFSRLKHERELQIQDRMQRMQMQQEAQRRALHQARTAQQQNPQQYGAPNGLPQPPRIPASANTPGAISHPSSSNRPPQLAVPGQNPQHPPMQQLPNGLGGPGQMPNGHPGVPAMPMQGIPQGQMQGMQGMPGGQHRLPVPNPAPDLRLVMQAQQISEQQRRAVQMQQQSQQHPGQNTQMHNSPPSVRANMNNMNQQAFMQNNPNMMSGFNAGNTNGLAAPPPNGLNHPIQGSAASPRMGHPNQPQPPHPNSNVAPAVNKLEASFRQKWPQATPEQIRKMVSEAMSAANMAQRQQLSQSAMHAAAGSGSGPNNLTSGASPQQYAQMLRAQQERQARENAAAVANQAQNQVHNQTQSQNQQNRSASVGSGVSK